MGTEKIHTLILVVTVYKLKEVTHCAAWNE